MTEHLSKFMPPGSQVIGGPTVFSLGEDHLEVMGKGLGLSTLNQSQSCNRLTKALGCVSNWLGVK